MFDQTPNGWGQAVELTTRDYRRVDGAVAINGDAVVVGAPLEKDNGVYGLVYIFERNQGGANNWGLVTKLAAPLTSRYDFGISVAISGDIVVVGARDKIHIFEKDYVFGKDYGGTNNWGQVAELTVANPPYRFGQVIAVDGDTIVVGLPSAHEVVIFERNQDKEHQWEAVIVRGEDELYTMFGQSVAIKGDRLVVGARDAAYIFERINHRSWQQMTKLPAPDARAQGGGFGRAVAMGDNTIVVGATGGYYYSGSAYIFVRDRDLVPLPSEKPPLPDLVVIGISEHVLKSGRGCVLDLSDPNEYGTAVRIKNIGQTRAKPFEVRIEDRSQMVTSGLEPGQDVTLMFPYGGKTVELDATSQIDETNEDNNMVSEWLVPTPTRPPICTPTPSPTLTPKVIPRP